MQQSFLSKLPDGLNRMSYAVKSWSASQFVGWSHSKNREPTLVSKVDLRFRTSPGNTSRTRVILWNVTSWYEQVQNGFLQIYLTDVLTMHWKLNMKLPNCVDTKHSQVHFFVYPKHLVQLTNKSWDCFPLSYVFTTLCLNFKDEGSMWCQPRLLLQN